MTELETAVKHPEQVKKTSLSHWFNPVNASEFDLGFTDQDHATFFVKMFSAVVRYNKSKDKWLVWNGHTWETNEHGNVPYDLSDAAADARKKQAFAIKVTGEDDDLKRKLRAAQIKNAEGLRETRKTESVLKRVKARKPIVTIQNDWDKDEMLLGLKNGVLELRTGTFRAGRQADHITKRADVYYDPAATSPVFDKFIIDVLPDPDVRKYVQKALGYALTGDVREQILHFCHGSGSNGKSKLLEITNEIMGDYGEIMALAALENTNGHNTNDLAGLQGMRFVVAAETQQVSRFNEAKVKQITGESKIKARFLYQEFFEFKNQAKLWLSLNHLPRIEDTSDGMWRRIRIVPFNAKFEGEKKDLDMGTKLQREKSGILNWLIQGCLLWQKEGLKDDSLPAEMIRLHKKYRLDNDLFGLFLDEMCEVGPDKKAPLDVLRERFNDWLKVMDERRPEISWRELCRYLEDKRGFEKKRVSARGDFFWYGLDVRPIHPYDKIK